MRSRNALLKQRALDEPALEAFTRELVEAGNSLIQFRRELIPEIAPQAVEAYGRVSGHAEPLELEYQPSVRQDFALELARLRPRELAMRMTLAGPHRDDLILRLDGKSAAKFASEGQKRSLAIALKMTQAERLAAVHGAPPILLIDDVMGELDARRRGRIFAPAQPGAARAQPGVHDVHGGELAARAGPGSAEVGSQTRGVARG